MDKPGTLLGPMRPAFLILTPICILLGLGTAFLSGPQLNTIYFVLILIGGLSAHISVNTFNEYYDFKSGLDYKTKRTPFSGGSGTLPNHPEMAAATLNIALITLAITIFIGLYFTYVRGFGILPLGLIGITIIISYSTWITRHPFISLIAPGLGFGPLMVVGTHFILTGEYSWPAMVASLIPFFLVNNLLLVNQFPDVGPDRETGRRNIPIVFGCHVSSFIYAFFIILTYLSLVIGVMLDYLPWTSLMGLATTIIAIPAITGINRFSENSEKLVPYLGINIGVCILTPLLVALGCFL